MKCVEIIHLYQESYFSLIHRFRLFLKSLFFVLIHYAHWLVKYHDNLLVAPNTHPEVYEKVKKRMYGIKRTLKLFSRSPVDLELEITT